MYLVFAFNVSKVVSGTKHLIPAMKSLKLFVLFLQHMMPNLNSVFALQKNLIQMVFNVLLAKDPLTGTHLLSLVVCVQMELFSILLLKYVKVVLLTLL